MFLWPISKTQTNTSMCGDATKNSLSLLSSHLEVPEEEA